MDPVTDCQPAQAMRSSPDMVDVSEIRQRIEILCARAGSEKASARLLVEIEDLLAEGYLCALHWDHHGQHLKQELDTLLDEGTPEQLRSVAREQRRTLEAARDLRSHLAVMREHWVALGSDRLGLA
jgi:hypothetical protein